MTFAWIYRPVFYLGVGVLSVAVGLGVYEAWRTERRPPRLGFSNLEEIDALLEAGRDEEAIARLEMTLELVTRNRHIPHNMLGRVLQDEGRYAEAAEHYRQAVHVRPDFVEGYNNLGIVLAREQKWVPAIAAFRQAIVLDPGFEAAIGNLGLAAEAYRREPDTPGGDPDRTTLLAEVRGLLGGAGGTPTTSGTPSAGLLRGRQGVTDLYAARLDALHARFTPGLSERMGLSRLQAFHQKIADQLGREVQLLREEAGDAEPASYSRLARFEKFAGIVEIKFVFSEDGRIDDLRLRLGDTE